VRVLTVVGNRPQFVKAAAVSRPLRERHEEVLVHTGQHHDDELSAVFFEELGIPRPTRARDPRRDEHLADRADARRARAAARRDRARRRAGLRRHELDAAGGLGAAQAGVPVAHVEAGMRSFDRRMPEELNRVLVDHLSDLLLCSTDAAWRTSRAERVAGGSCSSAT
jgi:UDP-N-acetylglucosamine 2-epimerase (non-hydrolysing)/UDP-GlcNAc3NAcA epimerase